MKRCEGDCDRDTDCAGKMKCYQRNDKRQIPGCKTGGGGDNNGWDYCFADPTYGRPPALQSYQDYHMLLSS